MIVMIIIIIPMILLLVSALKRLLEHDAAPCPGIIGDKKMAVQIVIVPSGRISSLVILGLLGVFLQLKTTTNTT